MLRANHFVDDHEQGVRSAPRGTASQLAPEIGQNRGRTETMYTYPAHFQCRVRARRGDDMHAERCLRDGRDRTPLRSVLGVHVVAMIDLRVPGARRPGSRITYQNDFCA